MTALAMLTGTASFAAQAVRRGPHTLAPPSFDGHGWLVVINMGLMSWATTIAVMVLAFLVRAERLDGAAPMSSPARIWRVIGMFFAGNIALRCGIEAANLWAWNPRDAAMTGHFLFAKRLVDPFAVGCGVTGLVLYVLAGPGMLEQLRKKPAPIRMWQSDEVMHRIGWLGLLSFAAALGVVSTR